MKLELHFMQKGKKMSEGEKTLSFFGLNEIESQLKLKFMTLGGR